jgi:hypothetical protein
VEGALPELHMIFQGFQALQILSFSFRMLVEPVAKLVLVLIIQILPLYKYLRSKVCFGVESALLELLPLLLEVKHLRIEFLLALRKPVVHFLLVVSTF